MPQKLGFESHPRRGLEPWSGRLLYPVHSRRSGGLSLGINLFPDSKLCNFDCAYCEVLPPPPAPPFDLAELEAELEAWAREGRAPRDLSISGDGEPTLSSSLVPAISLLGQAKTRWPEAYGGARLVLITNSTGFLNPPLVTYLREAVDKLGLDIWAKLDAATEGWYSAINRRGPPLGLLLQGIRDFAYLTPITIQIMRCSLSRGAGATRLPPSSADDRALIDFLHDTLVKGGRISALHFYTQARPALLEGTAPLDDEALADLAHWAIADLKAWCTPIRAFGARGEIDLMSPKKTPNHHAFGGGT